MQKLLLQAENRLFHCLSKLQQGCTRDISLSLEEGEKAAAALTETNLKLEKQAAEGKQI